MPLIEGSMELHGFTPAELGRKCGVSSALVRQWMRGDSTISPKHRAVLVECFGEEETAAIFAAQPIVAGPGRRPVDFAGAYTRAARAAELQGREELRTMLLAAAADAA